ncbi:glycosyltransferase family 87 protein [Georgenia daeguensis]|uniref:Glycosyltransferase family 87 protein n=1 Tax=Georgenia daeguensis TaxID=908355 RepID=A0ABP8ER74_9MICO
MSHKRALLLESARTGAWLDRERLRAYPAIFLGLFVLIGVAALVTGDGVRDGFGNNPLGTDFLSFYAASELLMDGRPEAAYDHAALKAIQDSIADDSPLYTWLYPPIAFFVVAPLSLVPYLPALLLWLGITFSAYVAALWKILPDRRALVPMAAFPAVFLTVGHGQNSFLSAALLGWGLVLLRRHPWLAGSILGLLIYKPQLGLLLPVAFIASKNWRAFLSTGTAAALWSALSYWTFGKSAWQAYMDKSSFSWEVLEQGLVSWSKMVSAFPAVRLLGGPIPLAWTLQTVVSLIAVVTVWRLWHSSASTPLKIAALATGTLLATPFALDYEATLIGLALAAYVKDGLDQGFLSWEKTVLAAIWVLPLLWRTVATGTSIPLGTITILALLLALIRRYSVLSSRSSGHRPASQRFFLARRPGIAGARRTTKG